MNETLYELLDEIDGDYKELTPSFAVKDIASADWTLRKILRAQHNIEEREITAEAVRAKLNKWLAEANKPDLATIEFMQGKLESYVSDTLQGEKRRSVKLPSGTAGFRASPEHVEVQDEAAALAWCEANLPAAVKTKKYLSLTEIKASIKAGGAMPEAVRLAGGETRFYVKEENE